METELTEFSSDLQDGYDDMFDHTQSHKGEVHIQEEDAAKRSDEDEYKRQQRLQDGYDDMFDDTESDKSEVHIQQEDGYDGMFDDTQSDKGEVHIQQEDGAKRSDKDEYKRQQRDGAKRSDKDEYKRQQREIQDDPRVNEKVAVYSTFHGYKVCKAYDGEQIKVGLRVVRTYNYESGPGREIGTIVNISQSGRIKVQWDTEGNENLKKGTDDKYTLKLFDNAQTGVKHTYVQCKGCNEYPLRGIRWKCKICRNFNLCTNCYMADEHDMSHTFKRLLSTNSKGVLMAPRENQDFTRAVGIVKNSSVHLRNKPEQQGRVEKFLEKTIETCRSDAKVKWNDNLKRRYCVGRNGQCDLKFIDAAKGPKYYEDHLPIVTVENVQKGARVVRGPGWNDNTDYDGGHGYVGTVTSVGDAKRNENIPSREESVEYRRFSRRWISQLAKQKLKHVVTVQWDNGNRAEYELSSNCLRLFDNGPSGVEHEGYLCDCCPNKDNNIRGIRWKCTECDDFDLCNICYMSDEHDLGHTFRRLVAANLRENIETSRECSRSSARQSYGIFKGATVVERAAENDRTKGTVIEICDYKEDTGRSEVEVWWDHDDSKSVHRIVDLKCDKGGVFLYYYNHLPALGRDSRGYFEVNFDFDSRSSKKIQIDIWRTIQKVRRSIFRPSLYLIFANHTNVEGKDEKEDKFALMEEVFDFAKKTKLPCHVVGQKVLFHSGSITAVCVHHQTEKDTVKELVKKGFRKFQRGDIDEEDEDEIHYFIRMAEYALGEAVLPVVISLKNGGMTTEVKNSAAESKIPIVRLKIHSLDVSVLTPDQKNDWSVHMTEHRTDIKNPWSIKKSKPRNYELGKHEGADDPDEITLISEIQMDFRDNLDALVCCLLIGVSMEEESLENEVFGALTKVYPNALSMYLLKEGKWRIPKEIIKTSFSYRSIEYIYEENMTSEIRKGLWSNLKSKTQMAYKTPDFREKNSDDSDYDDESDENSNPDDECIMSWTTIKIKGTKIKLKVSTSELYGLIFFALLQKQYSSGAKQLIETGCIRIRHILIGCVILEDAVENCRTSPFLKEKLQQFKNAFTQRAIQITSCIHDADKKKKEMSTIKKDSKSESFEDDSENKEEKELGEYINHAGRLLLNHGYIKDAIKTENKNFLDNSTVKGILNEMWYGTEKLDTRTIVCFIGLAVVHMIVLPLLMINMEARTRPLIWFYKKYKLPFMKVFLHMLGFLALLNAYAYMLLFDYSDDGITYTDYFIIAWMVSFFVDESKQHIVSIIRRKWKSYANDWWNRLDWLSMIVYASGMLLKLFQEPQFRDASKVLLVAAFILLSIRILKLCCMSAILGPKLVMIREMFRDTFSFMIIMTVMMMCYNISFYALLYPNSEFSWQQMEKIIQNGYWMLFGELNLDGDTLSEPDCTFNRTVYESSDHLQRCPTPLGVQITPYLKAVYGLIAVILLLNLLIAMYSDTFQKVHQESEFYWSQLQTEFLEEYSIKTIFPLHLQLLVLPITILHAILWFCCPYLCGKLLKMFLEDDDFLYDLDDDFEENAILNHRPMFVRVFLYNTNFDLKLKTTSEAEGKGALNSKGEISLTEVDRITTLQRQLDTNSKQQEKQNDKNDRRNQKMMGRLQNMDKSLKGIKRLLSKLVKSKENEEDMTEDEEDEIVLGFSSSDEDDSDSRSMSSDE